MKLHIHNRGVRLSDALELLLGRQLLHALRPHGGEIRRVHVQLVDLSSRGTPAVVCSVRAVFEKIAICSRDGARSRLSR